MQGKKKPNVTKVRSALLCESVNSGLTLFRLGKIVVEIIYVGLNIKMKQVFND